jgi:hypothetical protein
MQKPLVDESFEDLMTRLITANRTDRAQRDKASRGVSAELRGLETGPKLNSGEGVCKHESLHTVADRMTERALPTGVQLLELTVESANAGDVGREFDDPSGGSIG